ncbi:MFS transporter [Pseudomonas japonica]|uniref:MFS transporter, DHA2 family, multidrug resistance protein n=1 Tax=Pseudomonas japonica TaxID=256466 RepID=A0A239C2M8_9PSED|nr:MFS transporter [Pseudomonas japonica]SNS14152.1 MFS transporter, DHA2 family, multidrug resistance protein [Pseudomonas japonica]
MSRRPALAIGAVLAAMVLVVLNTAMIAVALPTLATALRVAPASVTWILTAHQAALLMALLPCAALGESLGYRRVFTWGVWLFAGGSLLCVVSPSLAWLVAARVVQGFGAAAVMALGVALLRQVLEPRRLGAAIAWNALAVALSSAASPVIGAALLSVAAWPGLFALHLPLAAGVLLAARALPASAASARRPALISILLNAGAFAALTGAAALVITVPPAAGLLLACAALQLWLLVRRERSKRTPLIPLDLLASRSLRLSVIASVLCFAGQTAGTIALPFLLQHNLGLGTWMTGLLLLPWPLSVAITAPFAGRLAERIATARLCCLGGTCLATGLCLCSLPRAADPVLQLIPPTLLCGFGFALFNVANNRNLFLAAPVQRSGAIGGLQGTARLLGQTAGGVLMALLFERFGAASAPRLGLGVAACLVVFSAWVSLLQGGTSTDRSVA